MNVVKVTQNQFDPSLMVTVVDVTVGLPPDTLNYNLRDKDRTTIACDPSFEDSGDPQYLIPRFYAERLLQNLGGRTFRLVSPSKLIIKMPNGKGGTEFKTILASKKCGDGLWHEMTAEEILEIESGKANDGAPVLPSSKTVEPKASAPVKKGVSKKAKVETVEPKVPEDSIEGDSDNLEVDEPTLNDVLGD